jgi:hypothetical protein
VRQQLAKYENYNASLGTASPKKLSENYQKDMTLLLQVKDIQTDRTVVPAPKGNGQTVLTNIGGNTGLTTILQKHYSAPCYTCTNNAGNIHQSYMNQYLRDVQYFARTYVNSTSNNVSAVFDVMKGDAYWQVRGAAYMLKYLNADNRSDITFFEDRFNSQNGVNGCNPDARQGTKVVEFKSWAYADIVSEDDEDDNTRVNTAKSNYSNLAEGLYPAATNTPSNSYTQFRCYINNIDRIENLEYIFDATRLKNVADKEKYVKEVFQKLLYKANKKDAQGNPDPLTDHGKDIFNIIWGNTTLRGNIWTNVPTNPSPADKLAYSVEFTTLVCSTNSSFYKFINVR